MVISGLIFFGDSVLAGTGASEREKGCAKLVKNALKEIPVSLKARNWNTSKDGLERLEDDVLENRQHSHVIILFGNNDGWLIAPGTPKLSLTEFKGALVDIINQIKNNQQVPILLNLQLIDGKRFEESFPEIISYRSDIDMSSEQFQEMYSEMIEKVAQELNISFLDIRSRLKSLNQNCVAEDGLHPNDLGHSKIAEEILKTLKKLDPSLVLSE